MNIENGAGARMYTFYGWWILLAGVVIVAIGLGSQNYMSSLLARLIRDEFGGGAEAFGLAISIPSLVGSAAWLVSGPFIDRFGPRRLMLIGIPLASVGFLGLSLISTLLALSVCVGLIGIGASIGFLLPVQTATANWFVARRVITLAIISAAAVLGVPLMGLVGSLITNLFGWRSAFLGIGLVILVIGIPLARIIRHRPEEYGYLPDGKPTASQARSPQSAGLISNIRETNFTLKEALRTHPFWLLSIAGALAAVLMGTVMPMYTMPMLIQKGLSSQTLLQAFETKPVIGLVGILIFGYLGDIYQKRYLLALSAALQSASVLILMIIESSYQVYVYLLVLGLGFGIIPLMLAIRADYFGRHAFATITVAMAFISGIIGIPLSAFFPALGGWLRNITGSYVFTLLLLMLIGFVPAVLFLLAKPPTQPKDRRV